MNEKQKPSPAESAAPQSANVQIVGTGIPQPGRLGNRIFQAGLAIRLGKQFSKPVKFSGFDPTPLLPKLGSPHPAVLNSLFTLNIQECNSASFTEIVDRYNAGTFEGFQLNGWGTRVENVIDLRKEILSRVESLSIRHKEISRGEVLVPLRLGDIATEPPTHADYYPLPISFYRKVLKRLKLRPVFAGQIDKSDYVQQLRDEFQEARFLESGSELEDFETIRRAHTKVLPISTYSWLAGWLGDRFTRIVMPISGAYHPLQRPDWNLTLFEDPRFRLYYLDPLRWERGTSLVGHLSSLERASLGYPRVRSSCRKRALRIIRAYNLISRSTRRDRKVPKRTDIS